MKRDRLFLSTVAADAAETARAHGFGIEIAEYCWAVNMDAERFPATDRVVRETLSGIGHCTLHAPFNELFPSAIEPRVLAVTRSRFEEAAALARSYGAERLVLHSGFYPTIYYPAWYEEQTVSFFRAFLADQPQDAVFCLENVLETDPALLPRVVRTVDDTRLRLCLDIGHAHCYSPAPWEAWLEESAGLIAHFHLHNNFGERDEHLPLDRGSLDMEAFLRRADALFPNASYTIENELAAHSAAWLEEKGLIEA